MKSLCRLDVPEGRGFEKEYQHIFLFYFPTFIFFSVIKFCLARKSRIFKDRKIKSREKNLRIPLHAGQLS